MPNQTKELRQEFVINASKTVKIEKLDGVEHYVLDAVIMVEGVHVSKAMPDYPLFYSGSELEKWEASWDHKPVTVSHPKKNGKYTTASKVSIIESVQTGLLLNTRYDKENKALKTQAWVGVEKIKNISPELEKKIKKGEAVEVSIGLSAGVDEVEGTYGTESYVGSVVDFRPNHLALLENEVGACSCKKGCGINNEGSDELTTEQKTRFIDLLGNAAKDVSLSFNEITNRLAEALRAKFGTPGVSWYGYPLMVYSTYCIYCDGSSDWLIDYKVKDDKIVLSGTPEKVVRVVSYATADGKNYVTNSAGELTLTPTEDAVMSKKAVDDLIANESFTEKDRVWLDKMEDDALASLTSKLPKKTTTIVNEGTPPVIPVVPKQLTEEEFMKTAPPSVVRLLNSASEIYTSRKAEFVEIIMASPNNIFTKEELDAEQDLKKLEKMAVLAKSSSQESEELITNSGNQFSRFLGMAGGDTIPRSIQKANAIKDGEGLSVPSYVVPKIN